MTTRRFITSFLSLAAAAAAAALAEPPARKPHNFAKWEKEIAAFEAAEKAAPTAPGGIVFTGSSTVRLWKTLAADFAGHCVVNRGFGGCEIADCAHFAPRIIIPLKPKAVFLRCGGNDINNGRSAQEVFEDFQALARVIHEALPQTKVVFISLCPTIARWDQREENSKLNALAKAWAATDSTRLGYVDAWDISINAKGEAIPSRFVADKLHHSAEGYQLLAARVRPHLESLGK